MSSPEISIDSFNFVGKYYHTEFANTCAKCSSSILLPCLDDLEKGSVTVKTSIGQCGHVFHSGCIRNTQKCLSPTCSENWVLIKELTLN